MLSTRLKSKKGQENRTCQNKEDIDFKIHQEHDGNIHQETKIKRKWQLVSLDSFKDSIHKMDKDRVTINSATWFTKLVAVAE